MSSTERPTAARGQWITTLLAVSGMAMELAALFAFALQMEIGRDLTADSFRSFTGDWPFAIGLWSCGLAQCWFVATRRESGQHTLLGRVGLACGIVIGLAFVTTVRISPLG